MKILFLVPYPVGEAPSQRFRFEQYFELLTQNQIQYQVSSFWSLAAWKNLYKPGHFFSKAWWLWFGFAIRGLDVFRSLWYDLIFIHRECAPVGPPVYEFILSQIFRKRIIYDFDDAIWLENTSIENKWARWIKFHHKVKAICRWSYKISCGNEWLADFARAYNGNVIVNPTTIDTESLHNPKIQIPIPIKEKARLMIGWTGTHSTLFYLDEIVPVLKILEKKYPLTIQIISNKNPNLALESVEFIPWEKEKEIEQLQAFDIGIMPLADDEWAKGKCGFKALQYMALSIPCVASAVGVNTSIIENNKNGFLCFSEQDWITALERLIQDNSLRSRIGLEGRKKIVESYSVVSNASNFLSLTKR